MEQVLVQLQVGGNAQYTAKTAMWQGKEFLVVPVVMMVEGVHSGSRGPIFHSATELEKSVPLWEGMPVTISHPQQNGQFVSANSEQIMQDWGAGHVRNAQMDGTKLKAEAWLDVQKLVAISPETLNAVKTGKVIEVSVGIFSAEDEVPGIWNNEQYTSSASDYQPDHLALLPEEIGACSISDGCGVRVNSGNKKEGGKNVEVNEKGTKAIQLNFGHVLMANAEGLRETIEKVRESLYKKDNQTAEYYLEEVYEAYAIFTKVSYEMEEPEKGYRKRTGEQLYKQTYTLNEDGTISWTGQPTKVVRKVNYLDINKKEVNSMCEPCKKKVDALIANTNTHFNESDREWLEALTEDKLDKMIPKLVQTNSEPVPVSKEKALEVLGIEKEQYEKGLEIYNTRRQEVITSIMANTESGLWTNEVLATMKLDVLEKIEKSAVKKATVYVGAGAPAPTNGTVAPMPLPGIEFEQNK